MPKNVSKTPASLEDQCLRSYYTYLKDEMTLLYYSSHYQERSLLLRRYCIPIESMSEVLRRDLFTRLNGILKDIVIQKMIVMVIRNTLHTTCYDRLSLPEMDDSAKFNRRRSLDDTRYRRLPSFRLLELLLNSDTTSLDFSLNKNWPDNNDRVQDVARNLWRVVGEKCPRLEKLVIPKELCYSNTLNTIVKQGQNLRYLTLKRNVPNNLFLNLIGTHCPNIEELDIAGADIVTDFGIICLLFEDPEQIFTDCWNREKTVGPNRKCQRAFPHPHFDKPIQEPSESGIIAGRHSHQFVYMKRTFHEAIKEDHGPRPQYVRLPLCRSLRKLRLENTRVKCDGASVIIECCPNVFSLGYLVFASAGLKQVYGFENRRETKFTEIFYRGPSDQKLLTIGNCCPYLNIMFLGSNSLRRLNSSVFENWERLQYLTLENIAVEDVSSCLGLCGKRLRGLKIQCSGVDLYDVASFCPYLVYFVIQNENPVLHKHCQQSLFAHLKHLEISSISFPRQCLDFIIKNSRVLESLKVFEVSGVVKSDFEDWSRYLPHLETLIVFRGLNNDNEILERILESFPSLTRFGNIKSMDVTSLELSRISARIKDENWDLLLVSSENNSDNEKEFAKMLSLHWFYLTPKKQDV